MDWIKNYLDQYHDGTQRKPKMMPDADFNITLPKTKAGASKEQFMDCILW